MNDAASLAAWVQRFPTEITGFISILREKGFRHFQRPLLAAVIPIAGMYWFVYRGSAEQLAQMRTQVIALTSVVKYAPKYHDLQDRLDAFYSSLPRDKDHARWLTENVRETLKEEGISAGSLTEANEENRGGFAVVSLRLTARLRYKQCAMWIARLERLRYPVHVMKLSLRKDTNEVGMNDVDVTVAAVFIKEGGR